jgi:hypothetical protein
VGGAGCNIRASIEAIMATAFATSAMNLLCHFE